jgi:hypothetical protein
MDQDKALRILQALAEGIDPQTGEAFGADSPYQQADVARALYKAVNTLQKSWGPKRAAPGNAGKAWTAEEDERLLSAFDEGQDIAALAATHGRSRLAIEARLAKFGKVPPPAQTLPSLRTRESFAPYLQ